MESYAVGESEPGLIEQTIGENFEATVAAHPDNEALVEVASGRRWTYAELDADVNAFARGLMAAGIAKGDRVGVWAPNCAEWTIAQYATAKVGAILVNVNPAYRTHEFSYAVNQSGLRLLIAATDFKTSDYRAMVEETWPQLSAAGGGPLERVVYIGTTDWDDLVAGGSGLGTKAEGDHAVAQRMASLTPHDPINIQYTSGTTGYPKGATLSHVNILNNGFFTTELINFTDGGQALHPGALLPLLRDGDGQPRLHLPRRHHGHPGSGLRPRDHVARGRRGALHRACTACRRCSSRCRTTRRFAEHDLSSLRTGVMAGSICPVEVMKRCVNEMHMAEVSIAYGMTETSPVSTQTRADDDLDRRTATIGRVHPHVEVKVVDPATGETVERGETGELCTRGYSVMLGYWQDEEKTREAIDDDGWMHTGDLAEMREDGYCNIVGRIKDMVIRGGENIYPREIEEFLYTHPDIEDVQVIGVPDEKYGEELAAWIKLRDGGESLDAERVRAVRDRQARPLQDPALRAAGR